MAFLIEETPEARAWVEHYIAASARGDSLGRLVSAVIWTDREVDDGKPLGGDPTAIVDEINEQGWPLTHGHDPGRPAGRVVAARLFEGPRGTKFIAAILAYYDTSHQLSFEGLGVDTFPPVRPPGVLPVYPEMRIQVGVDRREVADLWVLGLLEEPPVPVERVELSHNAADVFAELIRVGLPYTALVWNPLVKSVGEQAGKDIYAGIASWLRKLWAKMEELRAPIVELQSYHHGCTVSFLLRGKDVKQHYTAHEALSEAAVQAAGLVEDFQARNPRLTSLVYEFGGSRWFPSFGIMEGGQLVSNRGILIAYEQSSKSLSMGLILPDEERVAASEEEIEKGKKRQPRVFLSHSSRDAPVAKRIAAALSQDGQRVTMWETLPASGESFQSAISKAIAASDYLLVLLSSDSIRSPYVQSELEGALRAEMNDRAITVIPVLLEQVELPLSIRHRNYIDLSRDETAGIAQLQRQLAAAPTIDYSALDYSAFERMAEALLSRLGFETSESRPLGANDDGIDFVARYRGTDPFGKEEINRWLVQCKLYKQERVSVTLLQKTFALLRESLGQDRGLVITNGRLNSVARNFIADSNQKTKQTLRVIDGNELTNLLLRYPQLISEFFHQGER